MVVPVPTLVAIRYLDGSPAHLPHPASRKPLARVLQPLITSALQQPVLQFQSSALQGLACECLHPYVANSTSLSLLTPFDQNH